MSNLEQTYLGPGKHNLFGCRLDQMVQQVYAGSQIFGCTAAFACALMDPFGTMEEG
jgi:hypothetical protein